MISSATWSIGAKHCVCGHLLHLLQGVVIMITLGPRSSSRSRHSDQSAETKARRCRGAVVVPQIMTPSGGGQRRDEDSRVAWSCWLSGCRVASLGRIPQTMTVRIQARHVGEDTERLAHHTLHRHALPLCLDDLALGREHVPVATQTVDALPRRLAGLGVAHPDVERPAVVGDLQAAVLSACGPEK